jgi:hypothetical protein
VRGKSVLEALRMLKAMVDTFRLNLAKDEMRFSSVSAEWTHPFKNSLISSKNRCVAESCSNKM